MVAKRHDDDDIRDTTSIAGTTLFGVSIIGVFLGGFMLWSFTVPISGAVVAAGQVVTDEKVQIVRHERGGVLDAMNVREGEKIVAGQTLAILGRAEDKAAREELMARIRALSVRQVRLVAEQAGRNDVVLTGADLPDGITGVDPLALETLLEDQKQELNTRRVQLEGALDILWTQKSALLEEKAGLEGQASSLAIQLDSINEDVKQRKEAATSGLGRESALRELERRAEAIRGDITKTQSALLGLGYQISEGDMKMAAAQSEFMEKVSQELARVRAEKLEALEALNGRNVALARVDLKAPISGIVNKIHINTIGSAVEPFAPLFEIVAEDQKLLIEVRVLPSDIDDVYPHQGARVVLSAFNRHLVDPVEAKVNFVAADARKDEATGQPYYTVRLSIDKAVQAQLPVIVPGMPAEAYLLKHDRTFADYLAEPFVQSFQRAFRQ